MKLKPHRIALVVYFSCLVGALVWISLQGGALPYMTFFTVLLLPAASALYLTAVNLSIRFYQEMPAHRVSKAEPSAYRLIVENVGILPFVRVTLYMETELAELRSIAGETAVSLRPGERWEAESEIFCRYAGTYEVGLVRYRVEDCFHLLAIEQPVPAPCRVIVLPRIAAEGDPLPDPETLRNLLEMRTPQTDEAAPGNDVRDYRRGDSLRRIHWKNSARMQKLLTRLPEPREMELTQIVMIPEPTTRALSDVVRRDRFLELAVAVAYSFCRQNRPVVFYYPKGKILQKTVDSYDSFREFYENLPDELRNLAKMDDAGWDLWIRQNCLSGGEVLLMRERDGDTGFLRSYSGLSGRI